MPAADAERSAFRLDLAEQRARQFDLAAAHEAADPHDFTGTQMKVDAESAPQITRHLVEFAMAGLAAIAPRS